MRRFGIAAAIVVMAQGASAADLPILRGSYVEPTFRSHTNWEGFYVGGHAGYSSVDFDFANTEMATVINDFRNYSPLASYATTTGVLGSSNVRTSGFGGFVGYNMQWDDAVVSVEANYTHFVGKSGLSAYSNSRTVTNPAGYVPPAGHTYAFDGVFNGSATARVNDLITLRARGGYAMGSFMPYAFAGLAAGLIDLRRAASIDVTMRDKYSEDVVVGTDPGGAPITQAVARNIVFGQMTDTRAKDQKNLLTFGFTAGFGFEYLVTSNIFLRAEYEYTQLPLAKDTIIQLNTGRVGVGAKF